MAFAFIRQATPWLLYPPSPKEKRYPFNWKLGGPWDLSGRMQKISTGIRSPNHRSRSLSLYRLSYPGPSCRYLPDIICLSMNNCVAIGTVRSVQNPERGLYLRGLLPGTGREVFVLKIRSLCVVLLCRCVSSSLLLECNISFIFQFS